MTKTVETYYLNHSWQVFEYGRFVVSGGSRDEALRYYDEIVQERKGLSNEIA
jgi:hypothetical protein